MGSLQSELSQIIGMEDTHPAHDPAKKPVKYNREDKTVGVGNVEKLIAMVGHRNNAADLLGLTSSGLATMISRGTCSPVVDIAAQGVIYQLEQKKGVTHVNTHFVVSINHEKAPALCAVFRAMDAPYKELELD